jgi:hypothetical protein
MSVSEASKPSGSGDRYVPSGESPLFIFAMDHRSSFGRDLFGVHGDPDDADRTKMRDA